MEQLLRVMGQLTSLDLRQNQLGQMAGKAIAVALAGEPSCCCYEQAYQDCLIIVEWMCRVADRHFLPVRPLLLPWQVRQAVVVSRLVETI